MTVSDSQFKTYWEIFLTELKKGAEQYLRPETQNRLLHVSILPAHLKGYISTQFGVAVEFSPATDTTIEVVHGSSRVEDLLIHCSPSLRKTGPIMNFGGINNGIVNITFKGAFPFRLFKEEASIFFQRVRFEAGSWSQYIEYAEVYGDRFADRWTAEKAVIQAKDQLLVALVQDSRANDYGITIDKYIGHFKKQTVLLLGDYNQEGRKRLDIIANELKKLNYEPIIVKDIPDHPYQDLSAKVTAMGSVARFVVVDDSSMSGHLLEVQICKNNNWVTIIMREAGEKGSWMTKSASALSKVILELPYDISSPSQAISSASKWAEDKIAELKKEFNRTYPWRQDLIEVIEK
ncbi:MAG: hypothetical protein WC373_05900 [Smithella sp.]|jgi:hypothetical protein